MSLYSYSQSCDVGDAYFSTFEDIQSILDDNDCASCHASEIQEGNWSYDTYESLQSAGFCNKPIIVPGNASNSYLYGVLLGSDEICGESNTAHKVSIEDLDQIESWINHGAPQFCLPLYPEIKHILDNNNCSSCHNATSNEWRYDSYQSILGNNDGLGCGEYATITKGDAMASLLYDKINNDDFVTCGNPMTNGNTALTYTEIANIRDWINGGAIESQSTLPVVLSKFETAEQEASIILDWSTEIEIGTDMFIIERSATGRNFQQVAQIKAVGNNNGQSIYSYNDSTPFFGENYYRLKIVDLDGTFSYSNIRLTILEVQEAQMIISPNPAMSSERLKVTWFPRAGQESTYVNLVDPNGRSLHRKIIFEGTNYMRLPTLLDGVYYVIIEDYFGSFILERVVIIN